MDWLHDSRTHCWSVLTTMVVRDYISLVRMAHEARGNLKGQRDVVQTTTAKRIRERMISDIKKGAVIPPVVIGVTVEAKQFATYPMRKSGSPSDFLPSSPDVAIIDGMQRTEALMRASEEEAGLLEKQVRVEFWLARRVSAMVYRMLVLNTGQVPWSLSRQLSVVYGQLLKEIEANVPSVERILSPDNQGRRVGPAQFAADDLVELYLAFSLRKTTVDAKEALSEEFSRLDFIENLSDDNFQEQFYGALSVLTDLDKTFAGYESGGSERFAKGRNIFDAQPARIGLIVAIGQKVLGRPGDSLPAEARQKAMDLLRKQARGLVKRLSQLPQDQLGDFLKLDVLSEIMDRRVGQVGRYERSVFWEAFKVLLEEKFDVATMEPCWRAS